MREGNALSQNLNGDTSHLGLLHRRRRDAARRMLANDTRLLRNNGYLMSDLRERLGLLFEDRMAK